MRSSLALGMNFYSSQAQFKRVTKTKEAKWILMYQNFSSNQRETEEREWNNKRKRIDKNIYWTWKESYVHTFVIEQRHQDCQTNTNANIFPCKKKHITLESFHNPSFRS